MANQVETEVEMIISLLERKGYNDLDIECICYDIIKELNKVTA